ncbi:hypothetical protein FRB90_001751 [Tulasnella sp. 427]|nr:hypothetical protein FRB90_001751 [Tulasnella sp. 427]
MSTSEESSGLFEAKQVALEALRSNEAHQEKLRQFIARLKAGIDDVDDLIDEVEQYSLKEREVVEMDETQQPKCIQVKDSVKVKFLNIFSNPDSPFYEDAMKRERYLEMTKPRPWTNADRQTLRAVVIAEQKRRYALQLRDSGQVDVLDAVQAHPDPFYENMDATELDWEKVGNKVAQLLPSSTSSRSAADCKVQWLGSDHPRIKKGPWSNDEIATLRRAVKESIIPTEDNEAQDEPEQVPPNEPAVDWVQVSERLGGTRIAAECLRQWLKLDPRQRLEAEDPSVSTDSITGLATHSANEANNGESMGGERLSNEGHVKPKPKKKDGNPTQGWTDEEDEALLDLVNSHGKNNWSLVASMLPFSRSARQCSDRYRNSLDPSIRRAKWTKSEDENLAKAVAEYGAKWSQVKQFVPGRTGAQCRERWVNQVDPNIKRTEFTEEEDTQILELRAKGLDWPAIAAEVGGRTDNQCWRRWKLLQKRAASGPKPKSKKSKKHTQEGSAQPEVELGTVDDEASEKDAEPQDKPKHRPRPRPKTKATNEGDEEETPATRSSAGKSLKRKRKADSELTGTGEEAGMVPGGNAQPTRAYSLRKRTRMANATPDDPRSDEETNLKMKRKDRKGKGKAVSDNGDEERSRQSRVSVLREDPESSLSPAPPSPS